MKDRNGNIIDEAKFFGPLYSYVINDDITDIDYSGKELWVTDCNNIRTKIKSVVLDKEFIEQFTKRVSNIVSQPFHKMSPVLEAETDTLRITIVHEDVCQGKRCICIRKSLPRVRLNEENVISSGYMTTDVLKFLKDSVKIGLNMIFVGNPGVGKTECARFCSNYISGDKKVITIEDTPEWHYSKMNPGKDCVEITVGKNMDYTKAIKTCMRLNPKWMILSEARSTEVLSLIEGFSTGVNGMTTIHTDDVRNVPDRILNMAAQKRDEDRLLNDIYTFIDMAILIKRKEVRNKEGKIEVRRYIDQIALFSREGNENRISMILDGGNFSPEAIPESFKKRFLEAGLYNQRDTEWENVNNLLIRNKKLLMQEAEELEREGKFVRGGTYLGQRNCVGRA
ncbi:MAG: CpaF/VirB11 family protein [Lachnospiraceae bacterium]|nr:CpaF/VirB11 family protein [Lachnospiraceae bacterium]